MLGKRANMLLNSYPLVADKILKVGFEFSNPTFQNFITKKL
ncbi:MAG: hypothetical protein IPJ79_03215 [Bacteroidetes bacterium]|nr:hypothetical protein [Bacteroidota bacterium]